MWTNVKPQVSCFQACPQRRFNRIGLNGVTRSHSLVFAVGLLSSIREWFGNLQTCSSGIIANMQKPLGEIRPNSKCLGRPSVQFEPFRNSKILVLFCTYVVVTLVLLFSSRIENA